MAEKYDILVQREVVENMLPVIKDRDTIELLKEIAKEYFKRTGIDADDVRVFDVVIKAQPFVNKEPYPFKEISIAVEIPVE